MAQKAPPPGGQGALPCRFISISLSVSWGLGRSLSGKVNVHAALAVRAGLGWGVGSPGGACYSRGAAGAALGIGHRYCCVQYPCSTSAWQGSANRRQVEGHAWRGCVLQLGSSVVRHGAACKLTAYCHSRPARVSPLPFIPLLSSTPPHFLTHAFNFRTFAGLQPPVACMQRCRLA